MHNSTMHDPAFVRRVALQNYKSIANCDVGLHKLSVVVGPNSSGKSNFLDSLRFLAEALQDSLGSAVADRGGFAAVCRQADPSPSSFALRVDCSLPDSHVSYAFSVATNGNEQSEVEREACLIAPSGRNQRKTHFSIRKGELAATNLAHHPPADARSLFLGKLRGYREFAPVCEAFSGMAFYKLNPDAIRKPQPSDADTVLKRDGCNVASVLSRIARHAPDFKERIETYLGYAVPGLVSVRSQQLESTETVEFRQRIDGEEAPQRFLAASMSDGALQSLALLVALFQCPENYRQGGATRPKLSLIGLEEPESGLYPANAEALVDSLLDAVDRCQVIVTSHGSELLDAPGIQHEAILLTDAEQGVTRIGPLGSVDRSLLRDRLSTAGELLRTHQLQLDPVLPRHGLPQVDLFDFTS